MKRFRLLKIRCFSICLCLALFPSIYCQDGKDTSLHLYYKTGSFDLDSTQKKEVLLFVASVTTVKEVVGFTDTIGSVEYNRNLSKSRASQVYRFILPFTKVENAYRYLGEEFPQATTLSLNRKVKIVGYKKQIKKPNEITNVSSKDDNSAEVATTPLEILDSFEIRNLNFFPDKAIITPESLNIIPQLIQKIKSYKNAQFEIVGHVNYQSNRDEGFLQELYKLSERRARVIFDILVQNGVPDSSLTSRGVGNSQPLIIAPMNNQEKLKNMRVQIIVYKKEDISPVSRNK